MFRAFKRLFIYLGLMAEKATENDTINEAVIERGIRDQKEKASKANYANGQLAGQITLLKDQIKRQEREIAETESILQAAIAANDDANGSHYAEQLASLNTDLTENKSQLQQLDDLFKQNVSIIANSIRELNKFQKDFETLKTRVAIGNNLKGLSSLMQSSITELQGMGGELGQSMQQLRQSAAGGEGQMSATLALAKEMGSGIQRQQEAKALRGKALLEQYKLKNKAMTQAPVEEAKSGERQKIGTQS